MKGDRKLERELHKTRQAVAIHVLDQTQAAGVADLGLTLAATFEAGMEVGLRVAIADIAAGRRIVDYFERRDGTDGRGPAKIVNGLLKAAAPKVAP